ncbi:metal-dependent hydrolase [Mycobacterium avium subsp. hominissuis]|nr:metal-dependent hydrolase [Mycobacterium avium subsp. hominissuis]
MPLSEDPTDKLSVWRRRRHTHGKYFVNDDIVFSHFVANLSGAFPSGEELFIRSVRRFSDEPPVSLRVTPRRRENGGRVACRRRR